MITWTKTPTLLEWTPTQWLVNCEWDVEGRTPQSQLYFDKFDGSLFKQKKKCVTPSKH